MDDTISRQQAIDAVNSRKTAEQCKEGEARNWTVDACVDMIKQLPSVQPKRGKWMYQIGMVKCDQCLRAIRRIDHDGLLNFCPNCGAKMGDEDE